MEEGVKDINDDKNEMYDGEKEAEFLYDTSPDEMEEGVNYRIYYNNETNDEGKEEEFQDDTSPVDIEEGLSDRKDDKNWENY